MPICPPSNTEAHIKSSAKRVFIEKGYAATTIRDIAESAGANLALINYYFRSKEKLFEVILEETCASFFASMLELLDADMPLREKIERLIDSDFEFFSQNPDVPIFVLNALRNSKDHFINKATKHQCVSNSIFFNQIKTAIAEGKMRNIPPLECILLITSNIQFMFLSKPMLMSFAHLDEEQFGATALAHKTRIKEMIFNYLFSNSQPSS
jgi:TetR/AcrR family transcriptional regulator